MNTIVSSPAGWLLHSGNLTLTLDRATGSLGALQVRTGRDFQWSACPGDVCIRDDRAGATFSSATLEHVAFKERGSTLQIEKHFKGAPWVLTEEYQVTDDAVLWHATVALTRGDFRSCAITYHVPWPQPLHAMQFWAARENMPSAPHRFAEIALEYGEVTSGILIPALCAYLTKPNVGLLVAMPFDFQTPRFRFLSGLREPDLRMQFDRLALAPGHSARAALLFRGTEAAWRPALGWLYERYREYFEPRSEQIHKLWGGHVCGGSEVSAEAAQAMADLGLKWHEMHVHFPAYGNYHPERETWQSGETTSPPRPLSVESMRRTMHNLHAVGSAAMPYIQVGGDGDDALLDPAVLGSRITDVHGNPFCAWPGTHILNADPALPFGRDIARQIEGMVRRYPEMDGVFVDQLCYNFLDTAHDDGITAVNNRPAYMTGLNYEPHLEHLSSLLHPARTIIGNGPFGVGVMKYVDGFMAENADWLCDHFQYYALAKPMFFKMRDRGDRNIERMFQRCLIYGAGYSSYAHAAPSADLYRQYVPLLEKLFRRRWVFDANPLELPTGFDGNVYRNPAGALVVSVVSDMPRLSGRTVKDNAVRVRAAGIESVGQVRLHLPGGGSKTVPFSREGDALMFDVPDATVAAVAELEPAS